MHERKKCKLIIIYLLFSHTATVEFEQPVYSVPENSGSAEVCAQVTRIRAGSDAIQIRLYTEDDTAIGIQHAYINILYMLLYSLLMIIQLENSTLEKIGLTQSQHLRRFVCRSLS